MPRPSSRWRLASAVVLAVLTLAGSGCGGSKMVTVSGKIVMPQKVKLAEMDSIIVTFTPEDAGGRGGANTVSPSDLAFTLQVPPGKYKVAVSVQPYAGQKDSEKRAKELGQLVGMFDVGATALRHEVTADSNQTVTIDLAAGTVTKN